MTLGNVNGRSVAEVSESPSGVSAAPPGSSSGGGVLVRFSVRSFTALVPQRGRESFIKSAKRSNHVAGNSDLKKTLVPLACAPNIGTIASVETESQQTSRRYFTRNRGLSKPLESVGNQFPAHPSQPGSTAGARNRIGAAPGKQFCCSGIRKDVFPCLFLNLWA